MNPNRQLLDSLLSLRLVMATLHPPVLELERHQLGNGLRVVLHPDASLPLVSINLWYHTGSKNERPGKTGFAHLFEHMLFQGSLHVAANEHFSYIQQIGGVANASTWFDRTNYYETLPSHGLELGLWLESDRMGYLLPALSEEKLENQRQVVMNERRQRVDNQPYGKAAERLHELLYCNGHPYSWPVIGYMDDIASATLDDVREFFQAYYGPNNAVLTLAGDFDTGEARSLIEHYFGDIPPGPEVTQPAVSGTGPGGDRHETMEADVQLSRMYLAFEIPAFGERQWYVADLLSAILTNGKASLLQRDLVQERELAQAVGSYALPTEISGSLHLVATAKPNTPLATLERAILGHLEEISEAGIPEAEIDQAKNKILTGYWGELQTLDRRADLLSQFTTYFDAPERVGTEIEIYQDIERPELVELARSLCESGDRTRVHVVPRAVSS